MNIEQKMELFRILRLVSGILAIIFILLTIFLIWRFKIWQIFLERSGIARKKSISQMHQVNAATGRIMANPNPRTEKVASIESIPVCGVAIRNEATAPLEARSFLSPIAVGITPQEQSGSGIPTKAAYSTDNLFSRERYFV